MPKMKPLEEWLCDTCGEPVDANNGWIEWIAERPLGPCEFRITHNSPKCYRHTDQPGRSDMHLKYFTGSRGVQRFLSMLDVGPILDPDEKELPTIPDRRSFVDVMRRLHIPYYEEARLYFDEARADGWFLDCNEVAIFLPDTCKSIIERYEDGR